MRYLVFGLVLLLFSSGPAQEEKEAVFRLVEPAEEMAWPQTLKVAMERSKPSLPMDEEIDGDFEWWVFRWGGTEYLIGHDLAQRLVVIYRKGEKKYEFVRDFVGVRKTRRIKLDFTFKVGGGEFKARVPVRLRILNGVAEVDCWWESRFEYGGALVRVVWRPGKEPVVVDGRRRGIWRLYMGASRLTGAVTLKEGKPVPLIVRSKEKGLIGQDAGGLTFVEVDDGQVKSVHYAENGKIWLHEGRLPWARGTKVVKEGKTVWRLDVLLSEFKVEKEGKLGPVEPLRLVPVPVEKEGRVTFAFELQDARGRTARILRNGKPVRIMPTVVVKHKGKEVFRDAYKPGLGGMRVPRWRVPARLKSKEVEVELLWKARIPFKLKKHTQKYKVP